MTAFDEWFGNLSESSRNLIAWIVIGTIAFIGLAAAINTVIPAIARLVTGTVNFFRGIIAVALPTIEQLRNVRLAFAVFFDELLTLFRAEGLKAAIRGFPGLLKTAFGEVLEGVLKPWFVDVEAAFYRFTQRGPVRFIRFWVWDLPRAIIIGRVRMLEAIDSMLGYAFRAFLEYADNFHGIWARINNIFRAAINLFNIRGIGWSGRLSTLLGVLARNPFIRFLGWFTKFLGPVGLALETFFLLIRPSDDFLSKLPADLQGIAGIFRFFFNRLSPDLQEQIKSIGRALFDAFDAITSASWWGDLLRNMFDNIVGWFKSGIELVIDQVNSLIGVLNNAIGAVPFLSSDLIPTIPTGGGGGWYNPTAPSTPLAGATSLAGQAGNAGGTTVIVQGSVVGADLEQIVRRATYGGNRRGL